MKRLIVVIGAAFLWAVAAGVVAADWNAHLAALETAADAGGPQAQTELAVKYEHGEGVPKDFQKANQLYCRAARYGHAEAQFKLGWIYANARGVPRDEGLAAALFASFWNPTHCLTERRHT